MKRKKTEDSTDPAKFWPVPGVDGEPYPPRVQEALDLVEKETRRQKIRECEHPNRYPTYQYWTYSGEYTHECACRDCGAKGRQEIRCIPSRECNPEVKEARQRMGLRTPAYGFAYERREQPRWERQIQRASGSAWDYEVRQIQKLLGESQRYNSGALSRSSETYILHSANGEAVLMVPDSWYEDDH